MHLAVAVAVPILVFLCLVWRRADRKVAVLFAIIAAAYGLPYVVLQGTPVSLDFLYREAPWAGSTPPQSLQKNPLINDVPLQFLPWQEAARAAWRNGELPFHDRASGSGSPLWENPQAAVFFATSLAGLFTTTFAWPLLSLVTKLLLALWGMYLLLGTMRLSTPSRVFGAIAYAFSTFTIAFGLFPHTNVTALLPLLLASLHRVHNGWRGTAAATAVTTAILLAGHPEMVVHVAFIAIAYALAISWRQRSEARQLIPRFAAVGIVAALLAMPLLLPFAASIPDTQRYFEVQRQPSTHATPAPTLQNLVVLVIPNFYGNPRVHNYRHAFNYNDLSTLYAGLSTMALAMAAGFAAPRRHRFWIGLLAVSLLLSFQPAALAALLPHIPVIGLAPHGRMRFAITLALAVLGAHGLELLLRGDRRRLLTISAASVFALVVAICLASYPTFAAFGVRRLIFFTTLPALASTALIVVIGKLASVPVRKTLAGSTLPLFLLLDLVTTTLFYNPPNGRERYYPTTPAISAMQKQSGPGRVTAIDRAFLPLTARFYGLEDIRIHDPVAFRPYVAVLDAAGWDRSEYFGRFRSLPPQPLLDFLGVRYVLTEPERAPLALPVTYSGPDAIVHRNDSAMERFFVPSRVVQSASPVKALLASADRHHVFARNTSLTPAPARIELSRYDNNGATLRVSASSDTFIASSEVALPGWRLERNGADWPMIEINGAFLGWTAPPGDSEFRIDYEPRWFKSSVAASAAGLLLFCTMLWPRRIPQSARTAAR